MADTSQDYYARLGLSRTATQDEIKKAYRRLARQYHPDLHTGAKKAEMEKKFKELSEAYEVLKNEETRKKYDRYGAKWKEAEAYEQARQQAASHGMGEGWQTVYTSGEAPDFGDLFENLFGRRASGTRTSFRDFAIPGADLEATVQLTLREVMSGTSRRLHIPDSTGKLHTLDVRIPKGVKDGDRLRVKGKGAPGQHGGPPGDLFLRIHVAPHPVFHRTGSDLSLHLPLFPWEAALGTEVEVPTMTGPVRLKIPPGSQSGQKLRLKGKGLPTRENTYGDLFVILDITLPSSMTDQERKLYEQLRQLPHPDPRAKLLREAQYG